MAEPVVPRPDPERWMARLAKIDELRAAAYNVSVRTIHSYVRNLRPYDRFLDFHALDDDGDQLVIGAFVVACDRLGYDPTSTGTFLSAIRWRHRADGDAAYLGRKVLGQIKKNGDRDTPAHQAAVLSLSAALAMSRTAAIVKPYAWLGEFVAARDQAAINTAFGGALRSIELTFVWIEHFTRYPDAYYLDLPLSKTNREHSRHEGVWLHRRADDLDPVAPLDRVLAVLADHGIDSGPVFRSRREVEGACFTGFPPAQIRGRFAKLATAAGIGTNVSGYTPRRTAATLAHLGGSPIEDITILLRQADTASTQRYLADLPDVATAAFLDPDAPLAWAGGRTAVRRGDWSGAGPLESLIDEARELALDAVLGVKPSTRVGHLNSARRWQRFAAEEGIDPLRPVPEGPAWFLFTEAERGQSPRSLTQLLAGLEWYFAATATVPTTTMAFAHATLDALKRTPTETPRVSRIVEEVPLPILLKLTEARPGRGYWIAAAVVLLRHLDLPRSAVRASTANDARFTGREALFDLDGTRYHLPHLEEYLRCPACALELLVERAGPDRPLLSEADRVVVRDSLERLSGKREPRDLTDDQLPDVIDELAMRLRVHRRNRAGFALSYGAMLGGDELLAVGWEDLAVEGDDLVVRTRAGLRRLRRRDDAFDPVGALKALAAVWPWHGDGLWGCRGPVMAAFHPDFREDEPVAIGGVAWGTLLRICARSVGIVVTAGTFRVSAALQDWRAHRDIVRLSRQMGHTTVRKTEEFLRRRGVYRISPTQERA